MRWAWPKDGWLLALAYLGGIAARVPLWRVPPYGDEPMHYWIARHLGAYPANVSDVDGHIWEHPAYILWQRPAFYFVLHGPATFGFSAFRAAHLALTALLPVVVLGLLRSHGVRRGLAALGAFAAAAWPVLVVWGVLGFMDEAMTIAVVAALWARQLKRSWLSAALFLVAAWTKETALLPLALFMVWTIGQGLRAGTVSLSPLRLDERSTPLAWACAVAWLPITVAFESGLHNIGAMASRHPAALADAVVGTPWLLLPLAVGLAWPRSRRLCAFALVIAVSNLGLNLVMHRAVEAWYLVLPATLGLVGAVLATDEALSRAARHGVSRRITAYGGAALVAGLLLTVPLLQASLTKQNALHPFSSAPADGLADSYRFESRIRDQHRLAAETAAQMGPDHDVLFVDGGYAAVLYPSSELARHVYFDSGQFREVLPAWFEAFVLRAESNGTRMVVAYTDTPFFHAINEAYVACRVLDNGDYRVYEAWRCPGGRDALENGFRSRHVIA